MKKEFYIGQPLIVKETGKRVTCIYKDTSHLPYLCIDDGIRIDWYNPHDLEPSTEFEFSELIAGLEQGCFEAGTEFRISGSKATMKVKQGPNGLLLESSGRRLVLTSQVINSTWILVEH